MNRCFYCGRGVREGVGNWRTWVCPGCGTTRSEAESAGGSWKDTWARFGEERLRTTAPSGCLFAVCEEAEPLCCFCGGEAEAPPAGDAGSRARPAGRVEVMWRCRACGSMSMADADRRGYYRCARAGVEDDTTESVPAGCLFAGAEARG